MRIAVGVENQLWLVVGRGAEADDNDMNLSLLVRFAVPLEGLVSEIDVRGLAEEKLPEVADGLALTD